MFPIDNERLEKNIEGCGILELDTATIRQICGLAASLEREAAEEMVHLELGNPGLPAEEIGIEAEINALKSGVANKYPNINGIPELKENGSRFVKAFHNLDISPKCVVPTVGSMQGCFTLMLLLQQRIPGKDTMLFIHPGFPAQWHQAKILGMKTRSFDLYEYRGEKLREKLEEELKDGKVTGIIYSNPNNPAWTNLTEEELKAIGEMATKYDAIVLEDHAYMGMDFREYAGTPFTEPYVPTVAHYTDNYILLISASKIFSYAGQRIAIVCMSDKVYDRGYDYLTGFYEMPSFGECYVFGILYASSSGTSHSSQYAMSAMLEAAVEGRLDFVGNTSEYARRAEIVKKIFTDNGFHIVYDMDGDRKVADGFFFTVGFGNMNGAELQRELLRYGVAAITLSSTGSRQEGVRACVSALDAPYKLELLAKRLKTFKDDHNEMWLDLAVETILETSGQVNI